MTGPSTDRRGGIFARALSGTALTAGSYALTQALRLGSNLILTRLLVPEAFGLMALVSVVLVGLAMFSDLGLGPAISASPRGDDRAFLDTAYTINLARGAFLWLATCAAALPLAALYQAPDLALLLPVAGLTLLIAGLNPTRIDTANRHLTLARVTLLDIAAQALGILAMVLLALWFRSVWALVWGAVLGSAAKVALMEAFLPGPRNRLRWEARAAGELVHFGKWIFLSTACGFLLAQGDKAILGGWLPLADLGIYNIGWFLASFPVLLGGAVNGRIMIPIYRDRHPAASAQNAARLRRLRLGFTATILLLLAALGLLAVPLVGLLYDPRYQAAAGVMVLMSVVQMPGVIGMTYDQSALAAGDSRTYFWLMAARATAQTLAFLAGVQWGGLAGALLAQGAASLLMHGAILALARKHRAWDPLHDGLGFALALVLAAIVIAWNGGPLDVIAALG